MTQSHHRIEEIKPLPILPLVFLCSFLGNKSFLKSAYVEHIKFGEAEVIRICLVKLYITKWLRLKGTSGGHWSNPTFHAGPPGAGCQEPYHFSLSPRMKTPQPP